MQILTEELQMVCIKVSYKDIVAREFSLVKNSWWLCWSWIYHLDGDMTIRVSYLYFMKTQETMAMMIMMMMMMVMTRWAADQQHCEAAEACWDPWLMSIHCPSHTSSFQLLLQLLVNLIPHFVAHCVLNTHHLKLMRSLSYICSPKCC